MTFPKPSDYFSRLHIHILKAHAKEWTEKFPEAPIKRVLLYSLSFQLEGYMPDIIESYKPNPVIYAVVFEVDAEKKEKGMTIDEIMEYDRQFLSHERPLESYERLLLATEPNLRKKGYLKLVTADFANVYKSPAKDNYLEEWKFVVKFKNAELNADIRTEKPHVVLWEEEPPARNKTKVRPSQQDKFKCQKIAKEIWGKYPILDIAHMIKLPAIKKIVGRLYQSATLHEWLKEVAPERAKQPGRRNRETRSKQKEICEKLGI